MKILEKSLISATFLLLLGLSVHAEDDVLLQALQDEMERSLSELQLDEEPLPYFIAYTVVESSFNNTTYVLGAQNGASSNNSRILTVSVRVGDRTLDNTNWFDLSSGFGSLQGMMPRQLPLTDSYEELRREIWRATDLAYKSAVNALKGKKAALESQADSERPPDFSEEPVFTFESLDEVDLTSLEEISSIASELSSLFKGHAGIQSSSVQSFSHVNRRLFLDSEGNYNRVHGSGCTTRVQAITQAEDGAERSDFASFYGRSCSDLPSVEDMKSDVATLIQRLEVQRTAEELEVYNGPVLFEGQAAAEIVSQGLVNRLGAFPLPSTGNPMVDRNIAQSMNNPFLDKIDSRVLPRFISIVNDPTQTDYEGTSLLGSYVVDGEGMPSRRTELISNGRLEALLTTRSPTKSFSSSTGSNRGLGPMPGTLFVEVEDGLPEEELRNEMFSAAEDFGTDFVVVIRRIGNFQELPPSQAMSMGMLEALRGGSISIGPAIEAYKVFPDGSEVPIAPVAISNFTDAHFKDILAASKEVTWHNVPSMPQAMGAAMGGGMVMSGQAMGMGFLVSVITPALLFEDILLKTTAETKPKLPIVSHPLELTSR